MDNVNVFIVEDNPVESEALVEVLEAHNYNVIGVAQNFKDAIATYLSRKDIDLVIIDIFLGEHPDGISFAETINSLKDTKRPFLFLTSSTDKELFERAKATMPFNYMVKPFNELELLFSIHLAMEKFYGQNDVFTSDDQDTIVSNDYLYIQKGKSLKKVLITEIIFIEVEGRYCNIITEKGKFVILISLTKVLQLLDPKLFSKASRNFVVNVSMIEEIFPNDNLIILSGGYKVTLSDKYKDIIKKNIVLR
ncbi:LytTR family DNA-binding domain-containing protein [uncultured Tenacibaculum sp.]|uniref:LytR/AlgR family response regulator transcription factor n=1 Tax=uncultured Tenacibaculum sp. TaxID=174713 RepID=UPI00262101EA|nr:response regulator transcription factor [uncultured Tenacibaculum sp.]